MITEDQLEQLCPDWFSEGGYDIAYDNIQETKAIA